MLEDRLLIRKVKRGSRDALCRIYEKYEDDLLTLAINLLGDVSAAEDTVQDVFGAFARSVGSFRLTGSLKSYLATCVANRARDGIRKRQRHKTVGLDQAQQIATADRTPAQLAVHNEELQQLAQALAQLPYEQREAIILHLHRAMTFRQIAKAQAASVNTIKSRYRYGMKKLRTILKDHGKTN